VFIKSLLSFGVKTLLPDVGNGRRGSNFPAPDQLACGIHTSFHILPHALKKMIDINQWMLSSDLVSGKSGFIEVTPPNS